MPTAYLILEIMQYREQHSEQKMGVQKLSGRGSSPYENILVRKLSAEQLAHIEAKLQEELTGITDKVNKADEAFSACVGRKESIESIGSCGQRLREIERQERFLTQFKKKVESYKLRASINEKLELLLGKPVAFALEIVVLVLIAVVLWIIIYETYHNYELPSNTLFYMFVIDVAACTVFMFEFFLRMALADKKLLFFTKNWIDFVSSIPIPPILPIVAVDANTWFRVIRAARVLRLVRGFRIAALLWRGVERIEQRADTHMLKWAVWSIIGVILIGGSALHLIESQTQVYDQYVSQFGQSVWWSFNAVAIGGYADLYEPVFILTQIITAILLIVGLVAFGIFVATLTAIVMPKETELTDRELIDRVAVIEQSLKKLSVDIGDIPRSKDD